MNKKSIRNYLGVIILFILIPILIAGCGSDNQSTSSSSSGKYGKNANGIAYVGADVCIECHKDFSWSKDAVNEYLAGPHVIHSTHISAGDAAEGCLECHDPIGDGQTLEQLISDTTAIPSDGLAAVTCENCHDAGGNHYGQGPIPESTPDTTACAKCHNGDMFHNEYHPEGDSIAEYYNSSPHAKSINDHVYFEESTTDVEARCSKCHTDEGAETYKYVQDGHDTLEELIPDWYEPVKNATPVQCRTCHNAHNPEELLFADDGNDSPIYRTCTNCHQMTDGYHGENSKYSWSGFSVGVGTFKPERIIYETHKDDPTTPDIEGYNVNSKAGHSASLDNTNNGSCLDCHNPHNADNSINEQWARSAHGGHILDVKEYALANGTTSETAAVGEDSGAAWVHYDWKLSTRTDCQRCHTSTGFRNFINDPENYIADSNVFEFGDTSIQTVGYSTTTDNRAEMLYCWACHISNTGNLRDQDPHGSAAPQALFDTTAAYDTPLDRISAVGDLTGSNLCMSCHAGRQTGAMIKELDYATQINGKNFGTFNSHYLAAGGILFRTIGYEFAGLDYANKSYFEHDKIGVDTSAAPGTENGPCVSCHMMNSKSHEFLPVEKEGDSITAIIADTTVAGASCLSCHDAPYEMTANKLNEEREGYESALDALDTALATQGIYTGSDYPYFFKYDEPDSQTYGNAFTLWSSADQLGAAFNWNLLHHEPGAYTHNRYYTKRLIFDSIDFLDNGALDGTINLAAFPKAAKWYEPSDTDRIVPRP